MAEGPCQEAATWHLHPRDNGAPRRGRTDSASHVPLEAPNAEPSVSPTFHTCACDDACSAFNGLPVIYRWSGVVPEVRCCPRCAAHASGPQQCGGNRIARTQRRSLQRVLHARTLPGPGGNAKGGEAGALEARRRCVVGEKPAAPMKQDVATSAEGEQRCCEQQHELAPAVGDLFLNHAGHHGGTACVQPRMPAWRFAGWRD